MFSEWKKICIISYVEQLKPKGFPMHLYYGKFIGKDKVALILGDNFY